MKLCGFSCSLHGFRLYCPYCPFDSSVIASHIGRHIGLPHPPLLPARLLQRLRPRLCLLGVELLAQLACGFGCSAGACLFLVSSCPFRAVLPHIIICPSAAVVRNLLRAWGSECPISPRQPQQLPSSDLLVQVPRCPLPVCVAVRRPCALRRREVGTWCSEAAARTRGCGPVGRRGRVWTLSRRCCPWWVDV